MFNLSGFQYLTRNFQILFVMSILLVPFASFAETSPSSAKPKALSDGITVGNGMVGDDDDFEEYEEVEEIGPDGKKIKKKKKKKKSDPKAVAVKEEASSAVVSEGAATLSTETPKDEGAKPTVAVKKEAKAKIPQKKSPEKN